MNRRHWIFGALVVLVVSLLSAGPLPAREAQEEAETPPAEAEMPSQAEMEEMAKRFEQFSTPGEAHKRLEHFVGTWKTATRVWMAGPEAEPMVTEGRAEVEWILDGHFLMEKLSGEMMEMPFHGIGIVGYDNFKKKYQYLWVDSTSTAMFTSQGDYDESTRTFTYHGLMDEPMTGEHDKKVKYVLRIVDENTHVFVIHDPAIDAMVVEITYTRE